MKKGLKLILAVLIVLLVGQPVGSIAKTEYTAREVVEDMGIGWNLGNSLDSINKSKGYCYDMETYWGNPVTTKENIDAIAEAGYGAVRIPVSWYNHINSKGVIDRKWLARVAEVVKYALENDLYVIINVHHDAGMDKSHSWIYADTDNYEKQKKNLLNLWTQIASYFKGYDEHLLFEATNEIINADNNWDWGVAWKDFRKVHDLDQEFINIVRKSGGYNAKRCLVLSTWGASSDSCQIEQLFYKEFEDTVEDRLILSVHNYTSDTTKIKGIMSSLADYSEKYDIPVIIDEFGTTSSMSLNNRIAIAEKFVSTAKMEGITCFWWDDGAKYGLLNRKNNTFTYPTLVSAMVSASEIKNLHGTEITSLAKTDFADVNQWREGNYSYGQGIYQKTIGRICLKKYILADKNKAYTVRVPARYHMLIRELDKNGKLIKTYDLRNGQTYRSSVSCYVIGISIYCPYKGNEPYESYWECVKENSFQLSSQK